MMWPYNFLGRLFNGQLVFLILSVLHFVPQQAATVFTLPQSTRCRLNYGNLASSVRRDPGCSHVTCGSSCGALCPGSRDCQQNGVIVCKEIDLPVPFECGYDENHCYVFHRVSACTNGGTVTDDGACICPPGCIGQFCHQYVHTCHDIYIRNTSSVSGEYSLLTSQDAAMTVWCNFRSDVIVTYFSKSAIASLTTDELSLHYNINSAVDVVAKWNDGSQSESTLEQITVNSNTPISAMVNEFVNYATPQNVDLGPYLYIGFEPKESISSGVIQGYRSNGEDRTFSNCDSNLNSYFVFYANPNNQTPVKTSGNLPKDGLVSHWNKNARMLTSDDYLPVDYFMETEIHFGGCGGYSISYNWIDVIGLSLGLKHTKEPV